MIAQDTLALLFVAGIVAGFALLVALLLIQRARLRKWKRAHGLIRGDYRALLDSHAKLRAERGADLTDADRELLEDLAGELVNSLVSFDGEVLLDGAEAASRATIPVPVVEIEYPDRLVTLRFEVEHYGAEEVRA
jgi:hypothetical protein